MAEHDGELAARGDATPKSARDPVKAPPTLAEDTLEGVEAIARFLGPGWTHQRVYHARRLKTLPIRKKAGLGIYAFRSELEAALRAPETLVP